MKTNSQADQLNNTCMMLSSKNVYSRSHVTYSVVLVLKWYLEEETKELRESFENQILNWPYITSKKMFGCPCYLAKGKMFAGMVTKGIVITKLTDLEKEDLQKIRETKPFVAGGKTIRNWVHLTLQPEDLNEIMPYVKKSYERAIT
ncbi:MAG: hypothetical protein CW691_03470 [Candidatus Bathyarchaeum sp.]|nr:MAG: hypothetical protein CW691_03470 [Candidatus Bathyarchaeum sp.]